MSYDTLSYSNTDLFSLILGIGLIFWLIGTLLAILSAIAMWKIYKKLGQPGWVSLVPIYNTWVLFEQTDLKGWLCLIPFANAIALIISYWRLPKKLGYSKGYSVGMILIPGIFILILGFGKHTIEQNSSDDHKPEQSNLDTNNNEPIEKLDIETLDLDLPAINENFEMPALKKEKIDETLIDVFDHKKVCSRCGYKNKPEEISCVNCGQIL